MISWFQMPPGQTNMVLKLISRSWSFFHRERALQFPLHNSSRRSILALKIGHKISSIWTNTQRQNGHFSWSNSSLKLERYLHSKRRKWRGKEINTITSASKSYHNITRKGMGRAISITLMLAQWHVETKLFASCYIMLNARRAWLEWREADTRRAWWRERMLEEWTVERT